MVKQYGLNSLYVFILLTSIIALPAWKPKDAFALKCAEMKNKYGQCLSYKVEDFHINSSRFCIYKLTLSFCFRIHIFYSTSKYDILMYNKSFILLIAFVTRMFIGYDFKNIGNDPFLGNTIFKRRASFSY